MIGLFKIGKNENVFYFAVEGDTGHAEYIFDYSDLNENGEPKIALFDTEIDQKIVVANSFQELIENLKIQEEIDINYI